MRELVLRQGLFPVLAGLVAGVASALAATRVLSTFLFGVKAADPLTSGAVVLSLTIVAFLACYLPARRTTGIDPMAALRHE